MTKLIIITTIVLLLALTMAEAVPNTFQQFQTKADDAALTSEIVSLARKALYDTVQRGDLSLPPPPRNPLLKRPAGVFVTLVKDGVVRGCMGALDPVEGSASADIVRAAVLAATEDRRYPPILASELAKIEPVVSIVGPRRRVQSLSQLDPLRLGLFVERDGRGGVLLPGEALSAGYQVAGCKAKAGIPLKSPSAMYVFPTVVFQRRHP